MKNKPVVYLDSCCFIDVVKKAVGRLPDDRSDDVWHIKKLLEAHKAGDITVVTSFLSLAECVAVESGQDDVPPEVQENFRKLLTSGQYLILAPQTPRTGRLVQDLRWRMKIVLKGADALHIATALERDALEFVSADDRLRRPKMAEALTKLGAKGVRFIRGADTRLIPDRFLQGDMVDA